MDTTIRQPFGRSPGGWAERRRRELRPAMKADPPDREASLNHGSQAIVYVPRTVGSLGSFVAETRVADFLPKSFASASAERIQKRPVQARLNSPVRVSIRYIISQYVTTATVTPTR